MRDDVGPPHLFPHTNSCISLLQISMGQQVFLLLGSSWSRTYGLEAWERHRKASSSNASESQSLQNNLAVLLSGYYTVTRPSRHDRSQSVNTDVLT
jgi:hypothetical protein